MEEERGEDYEMRMIENKRYPDVQLQKRTKGGKGGVGDEEAREDEKRRTRLFIHTDRNIAGLPHLFFPLSSLHSF